YLLCIDDDNIVADVHARRVFRLVLAAQSMGNLSGQATQGLAVGINDIPVAAYLAFFGRKRLHQVISGYGACIYVARATWSRVSATPPLETRDYMAHGVILQRKQHWPMSERHR